MSFDAAGRVDPRARPYRVLTPRGELLDDHSMPPDLVVAGLRQMLRSRALDTKCLALQRQGRIGLYAPVEGQEAAVVGSHLAVDPSCDWLVPATREQPAMVAHGWGLERMLASLFGRMEAATVGPDVRMLLRQQSIATQLPHAAGLAWAQRIRGTGAVVLAYCGDGASSEGDFHEACNLAGVMRAPLVLVVVNNQYAISTPVSRQTAAERIAARAEGYGFPGAVVDGNDLIATYEVTRDAVQRARAGLGPTLVEAVTYRMGVHNTSDNPKAYRDDSELSLAATLDPIERVKRHLLLSGILTEAEIADAWSEAVAEVERAVAYAAGLPAPSEAAIWDHVYASGSSVAR